MSSAGKALRKTLVHLDKSNVYESDLDEDEEETIFGIVNGDDYEQQQEDEEREKDGMAADNERTKKEKPEDVKSEESTGRSSPSVSETKAKKVAIL